MAELFEPPVIRHLVFNSTPSSGPPCNMVKVHSSWWRARVREDGVITERIRYLLDTQTELTGREILGLTFTDKAAAEMKRRVVAAARGRGKWMRSGPRRSH